MTSSLVSNQQNTLSPCPVVTKDEIRRRSIPVLSPSAGKLAESLRGTDVYRQANLVFVEPSVLLHQLRINLLIDGKKILMPAPGLRDGFYLLSPFTVPHKKLAFAVSSRGLGLFGKKQSIEQLSRLKVDLLVTSCLAVNSEGFTISDGAGFFDLSLGLLGELAALSPCAKKVAVSSADEPVSRWQWQRDEWDARADLVYSQGVMQEMGYSPEEQMGKYRVYWDALSATRIKRVGLLWQLHSRKALDP